MKYSLASLGLAAMVNGHSIMQTISINGADQGKLNGIRAPTTNYPVLDVNSPDMACNVPGYTSGTLLQVPAGADVGGFWWTNVDGGASPDNPIAASHKGPITAWLARVDDAVSASHAGLDWFKVAEDNLDTTSATWGVDHMISGGGWHHFTMPSCIADGQYLLRIELLALHSAPSEPQFYASCAQIQVTGGGAFSPSQTQKIPGSYDRMDPSINAMIYDGNGQPTNNYQPYQAPGMRPITC